MCSIVEEYAIKRSTAEKKEAVRKANRCAMINGFRNGLSMEMASVMYPKCSEAMIEELYTEANRTSCIHKML